MISNKKRAGVSDEVVFLIPKIIFLTAVLFAVVLLVKIFIVTATDVRETESTILLNRLIYAKDGLSYFDSQLNRVYPGIIDLNRFEELSKNNPNILDTQSISYGAQNQIIAAKIILRREGKDNIISYYNKDKFDKWEPRALATVTGGSGSVKLSYYQKYILVYKDGKLSPGILKISIVS